MPISSNEFGSGTVAVPVHDKVNRNPRLTFPVVAEGGTEGNDPGAEVGAGT